MDGHRPLTRVSTVLRVVSLLKIIASTDTNYPFFKCLVKSDGSLTGAKDPGLNDFNAGYFLNTGVPSEGRSIVDLLVAVQAEVG